MVTTVAPEPVEEGPTIGEQVKDALLLAADDIKTGARLTFTGYARGSIRRPVLFVLVAVSIVVGWTAVALVALLLLALTDAVPVEG